MKSGWRAHLAVEGTDARRDEDAEDRLELFGGKEVAILAEGIARAAVVAVDGMIERGVHEAAEGDRTVAADFVAQDFGERGHGSTTRVCGVRMNISTR